MASARLQPASQLQLGKELLLHFVGEWLGVHVIDIQAGFGSVPDSYLFDGPLYEGEGLLNGKPTTLAVPTSIMLLPQHQALAIVQSKLNQRKPE